MSIQNRDLTRRWFEEVWNQRRAEPIAELMSPEVVGHMESGETVGLEEFLRVRERFLAAFPDLKYEVEDLAAEGDDVVVRWTATGTHSGDALGIDPCNRRVTVRGMTWQRFRDGVMVEAWDAWNQGALMQHLSEGDASDEDREHRLRLRMELSERLRSIREELYGPRGGPDLARRLGLPVRTWYNYETGVTMPAEVLLDFLAETGASPRWLRTGEGARYVTGAGARSEGGR